MASVLESEAAGNAAPAEETTTHVEATEATATASANAANAAAQTPPKTALEELQRSRAPEKYDLKPPDGLTFDPDLLAKAERLFRAADLPQENANELLGLGVEMQVLAQQAYKKAIDERAEAWRKEAEADPDIGGDKIRETVKSIRTYLADDKVLGYDGAKELIDVLSETGLANHKGLLKALALAAKLSAEDASIFGHGGEAETKTVKALYPNSVLA